MSPEVGYALAFGDASKVCVFEISEGGEPSIIPQEPDPCEQELEPMDTSDIGAGRSSWFGVETMDNPQPDTEQSTDYKHTLNDDDAVPGHYDMHQQRRRQVGRYALFHCKFCYKPFYHESRRNEHLSR